MQLGFYSEVVLMAFDAILDVISMAFDVVSILPGTGCRVDVSFFSSKMPLFLVESRFLGAVDEAKTEAGHPAIQKHI